MVLGAFLLVNLFIGVVVDAFTRQKEEAEGNASLNLAQQEWVKAQELVMRMEPEPVLKAPQSLWRGRAFHVVQHPVFEYAILALILLNAVVLGAPYFGMSTVFGASLEAINGAFAAAFTAEAVLKIMGLGWDTYWRSSWNRFDFVVVVATLVGVLLTALGFASLGTLATLVRTIRVGRILRIVRSARNLRVLVASLMGTLPALGSIGALLALLIFIYAIIGVQSFAHVQWRDDLNEDANFRTFGTAFLTLIRCSTGEDYNSIMYALAARQPGCSDHPNWDDPMPRGCGTPVAFVFFYSYFLIVNFVVLSQVVAIMLQGFSDATRSEDARLSKRQLDNFASMWAVVDPAGSMYVPVNRLMTLLRLLQPPLGLGLDAPDVKVQEVIVRMALPTYGGNMVAFYDVLRECARRAIATGVVVAKKTDDSSQGRRRRTSSVEPLDIPVVELPAEHALHVTWEAHRKRMRHKAARQHDNLLVVQPPPTCCIASGACVAEQLQQMTSTLPPPLTEPAARASSRRA
jgi:hypothetical protein